MLNLTDNVLKPKLSYAEKKAQKKKATLDDLDKRRKRAGSGGTHGQVQPPAKRPRGTQDSITYVLKSLPSARVNILHLTLIHSALDTPKTSKKAGKGDDAFNVSWRKRYASEVHTSNVSTATSSRTPAPRSYGTSCVLHARRPTL